jgi:hypothetical protein
MFRQRSTPQRSEALPPIVGTPVPTLFPNFYVINKLRRLSAFRIARIGGDASPPIPATLSNDPTGCAHPFRPDLVHAYRSWSFQRWHGPATPGPFGCRNRFGFRIYVHGAGPRSSENTTRKRILISDNDLSTKFGTIRPPSTRCWPPEFLTTS